MGRELSKQEAKELEGASRKQGLINDPCMLEVVQFSSPCPSPLN